VTSVTDGKAQATSYAYDGANHVLTVTAPGGAVTSYAYDGIGNMTRKTDPNAHVTNYTYDDAGRLATVADPLTRTWSYTYDANGNLTRADLPGGGSVTRAYDVLNRLTSIDYSDTTPDVQFAYDANGNRTSMTDGLGSASYTYNNFDRLLSIARGTDTFSYAYDAAGNVTQRTYPGNLVSTYAYDDDSQMASVSSGAQTTSFAYDAAGRLTLKTLPAANGYVETRNYDRAGRTTEVRHAKAGTPLSFFQYAYDAVGNPLSVTSQDGATTYAYDVRDRLTEACFASACSSFVRYAYDVVGNRLSETRPEGTTTYSYDVADQLSSRSGLGGAVSYSYDARGNQTQAGSRTFAWTLDNRLASTTDAGTTLNYAYDGDGVRLQATGGGQTTNFRWDSNFAVPRLALERDGAGSVLRSYVHGQGPVAMQAGGESSYFHPDALGSIANLSSQSGATQWTYSYEPHGLARSTTKNDSAAPDNPLRFAGEYLDDGTSLYHLRARQLDPATGRFLATDPLQRGAMTPAISSYAYADDRPTVFVDPRGLGPVRPVPHVLGATGGDGPRRPGPDPGNPKPLGFCPTDTTLACDDVGAGRCSSLRCWVTDPDTPADVAKRSLLVVGGAAVTAFGLQTIRAGAVVFVGCEAATRGLYTFACLGAGAAIIKSGALMVGGGVYMVYLGMTLDYPEQ
jgi:RHS repeat-associated protein